MVATAHDDNDPLVGRQLGRYQVRQRLARGGMASVYLGQLGGAYGFEKGVAIKAIHPHLAEDPRFVGMFLDEARLAAQIQHPNVCSVLDFGEQDGVVYLVMEHLSGESLSSLVQRGQEHGGLPRWLVARVVADAARGLHAAHELRDAAGAPLGLVHRDVSPENVMVLRDGFAKVVDFGVARARGRITTTDTGQVKGKFAYMSPEQIQEGVVDRRTDVWSLGVVLWQATLGQRLFDGGSQAKTAVAVLQSAIPAPSEIDPDYPAALERVVMGALVRDPDGRTNTAAEMAGGLEQYLLEVGELTGPAQVAQWIETLSEGDGAQPSDAVRSDVSTVPRRPAQPAGGFAQESGVLSERPRRRGRHRGRWATASIMLVALGIGGALWWQAEGGRPAVEPAEAPPGATERAGASAAPEATDAPRPIREESAVHEEEPAEGLATAAMEVEQTSPEPEGSDATEERDDRPATKRSVAGAQARSARRARRTGAASRVQGSGKLNLLSIPAAEVFLNGRSLGQTPLVERVMPAGIYRFELRPLTGGEPQAVRVRIRPNASTRRTVSLRGAR